MAMLIEIEKHTARFGDWRVIDPNNLNSYLNMQESIK